MPTIFIGSDHAGYELKNELKEFLSTLGYNVVDKGPFQYEEQDDYPDLISPVAFEISRDPNARGIVIGGSGQGEAMTANKFKGVRAAVYYGDHMPKDERVVPNILRLSREHNDANVLSLGARFLTLNEAKIAVNVWLGTKFSGDERHVRRIKKLDELK